jgi:heme/copper-type cytochrome/quinol oxidase subunit 2
MVWKPELTSGRLLFALALAGVVARADGRPLPQPAPTAPGDKRFEVTASRFKFEPEVLQVTEGDRVSVVVRSGDTTHGFAIKKLKVKAAVPKDGSPITVEFVATEPGTYDITCSEYCGSGHRAMRGRLVVVPRTATASR